MSDIEISADDPELPTSVEEATRSDGVGTHQGRASPTFQPDTPSGMEVESKVEPAHTQTVALVQTTLATYIQSDGPRPSAQVPVETTASHESEEIVPATLDSQQEFTMGRPHVGGEVGDEDLPIQAAHFLSSFDGCEVAVEGNGQCAMLAFYASISNNSTRTLKNTAATTTQASEVKRGVYALMMANLRHDVELGLIDPVAVYHEHYPDHPFYDSKEAATSALFTHYAQERDRPTNVRVPSSFWAGPNELRAMAQYLRDPFIVLDVNRSGDAQVQRYTYKMHWLTNGDDHESGCYEALSGRQARDYLHACWNLHVLPYFMIRNVSERHFYGVMHGERFVRWRAEGDPGYAAKVSDSYEWKQAVNYLAPEEDTDPDSLNKLADLNNVNAVLIKRITMREHLDVVHARLGLPTLDAIGYDDEADLEETIAYEERTLHEALGIDQYASGSQTSHDGMSMEVPLPKRYPRASTGEVVEHAYFRLLRAPEGEEIDPDDFAQYRLVTAANMEAFERWCSLFRPRLQIPSTKRRSNPRHIAAWLLGNIDALRHLFAFLPYPELEAKQWTLADLTKWGWIEVYREQTDAIWRITQDEAIRQDVRDMH
ncbi:hypothetical protein PF011_g28501 [Phytophthora fragariae]|uniref:OTU domain-containing protein n=1 Tax=Phytophthora fragariae TaxID=53985 RepID=A0A6A3H5H6_9STRA|nr:hypothetical protein PF011_g28501 [Phytophthora fragariae]